MHNRINDLLALLLVATTVDVQSLKCVQEVIEHWRLLKLFFRGKTRVYVTEDKGEDLNPTRMVADDSRCLASASLRYSFIKLVLAFFLLLDRPEILFVVVDLIRG